MSYKLIFPLHQRTVHHLESFMAAVLFVDYLSAASLQFSVEQTSSSHRAGSQTLLPSESASVEHFLSDTTLSSFSSSPTSICDETAAASLRPDGLCWGFDGLLQRNKHVIRAIFSTAEAPACYSLLCWTFVILLTCEHKDFKPFAKGSGDTTCVEDFISRSRWRAGLHCGYLLQR